MRAAGRLGGPSDFYHDCDHLRPEADAVKPLSFDVVVAGGGPAGVAAALSASRSGARVLLVEREAGLGGNVRAAKVHSICGLYRCANGPSAEPLQTGLAMEFARRLVASGGACGPRRFGRLDVLLQEPEAFAVLCEEWVAEAKSIKVMRNARVTAGEVDGRTLKLLHLDTPEGQVIVEAHAFVEATGDGNLAALANLSTESVPGGELQRPAYIFGLQSVAADVLSPPARLAWSALLVAAVRGGRLGTGALGAAVRPTCRHGMVRVTLDLAAGGGDYDPCDEVQVRRLTAEARESAEMLTGFLRREAAGFEKAEGCSWPERIGIRESRRVRGQHLITANEVLSGLVPEDTVCFSFWPLEWHEAGAAMRMVYPDNGAVCGVPLRALRSQDADNVFLAGRCLSATHEAQASLRVIGTSMATGQAAGQAGACLACGTEVEARGIREACSR